MKFRVELAPSRRALVASALLTGLALIAVTISSLHGVARWALCAGVLVYGGWMIGAQRRQPAQLLSFDGDPCLDGQPLRDAVIDLHGPWLTLAWRDVQGRAHRRTWWHHLDHDQCRRLRMALRGDRHALSARMLAP